MPRSWISFGSVLGSILLLLADGMAQVDAGWRQLQTSGSPDLTGGRMVFDRARSEVLLVGHNKDLQPQLETWIWDGTTWTLQCGSGCGLPDRGGFMLSYDASCTEVLLFGGYLGSMRFSDLWSWDGANWTQRFPTLGPVDLAAAAMCYDEARGQNLLYGGSNLGNLGGVQNGTWTLGQCTTWTSQAPGPAARQGHELTYDRSRQRSVLFGGEAGGPLCPNNDCNVYEWDGTAWNPIVVVGTSPHWRYHHSQAYDILRQRTIVFGGFRGAFAYGDTWEWDGVQWRQPNPGSQSPSPRHAAAMCYDEVRQCVVLYGGSIPTGGWFDDTWVYIPHLAQYSVSETGCAGSAGVPTILPLAIGVGPRLGHVHTIQIDRIPPPGLVFGALGFDDQMFQQAILPLDLTPQGMPTCFLRVSPDGIYGPLAVGLPFAYWSIVVPYDLQFVGLRIYQQAFVWDPPANQLGVTASNKGSGIVSLY